MKPLDPDKPFRVGWGSILNKYFKDIPGGFTKFYFFEFTKGFLTYRRLATSPDSEAITIKLIEFTPGLKKKLLIELFGKNDDTDLKMLDLKLPTNPGKTLGETKIKSLAEKYFSIPAEFRELYPKYTKKVKEPKVPVNELDCAKRKLKNPRSSIKKKRRVGRPKLQPKIPKGVRSITSYFRLE